MQADVSRVVSLAESTFVAFSQAGRRKGGLGASDWQKHSSVS